jgi:general secretion pathway protein C
MLEKLILPRPAWIAAHLALILLISWLAAGLMDGLIFSLSPGRLAENAPGAVTMPAIGIRTPVFGDYADIIRGNIFNPASAGRALEPGGFGEAAGAGGLKTSLNLKLLGTLIWGSVKVAVIQLAPDSEKTLRLHEYAGGAEIVSIERNRVGLLNNGRLETLEVEFGEHGAGAGQAGLLGGEDVAKTGDGAVVSRRYLDGQLKNMNQLLTQVRAVPNADEHGNTNGFKLFAIQGGSIYEKIGLSNQDVVQRINGMDLDSAEKGLELFQALRNEKSFNVDVLRGTQKTTLRFNIQ